MCLMRNKAIYDPDCQRCTRLSDHLKAVRERYPIYHARPVASFGAGKPSLLIVGLAPGMHGANASGRPFTGDHAGILLYQTLYDFGFCSKPVSENKNDGLKLINYRITNAVKCLPPQNQPTGSEIRNCNPFLKAELQAMGHPLVILSLGRIAHDAVLTAMDKRKRDYPFKHGADYEIDKNRQLVSAYHCSRYNTQTRRLTEAMFRAVFEQIAALLKQK